MSWKKRFNEKLKHVIEVESCCEDFRHKHDDSSKRVKQFIQQELDRRDEEVAEDICTLIDQIELGLKNTPLEGWKTFKHIRNAIRDKYVLKPTQGGK